MFFSCLKDLVEHLKTKSDSGLESIKYITGITMLSYLTGATQKVIAGTQKQQSFLLKYGPLKASLVWVGAISFCALLSYLVFLLLRTYYRSNGAESGKDFLYRLLAFFFYFHIRMTCLTLLPIVGLFFTVASKTYSLDHEGVYLSLLLIVGLAIYYGFAFNNAFKELAKNDSASEVRQV